MRVVLTVSYLDIRLQDHPDFCIEIDLEYATRRADIILRAIERGGPKASGSLVDARRVG